MNIALLLLLGLGARGVWAQPILFKAAEAPEAEYRARLKADEALRSPVDTYLNQHPVARLREQLLGRFARAQRAFLDGEVGEARRFFQEVTALQSADDWRVEQRELFLHAYLRLAQLETDDTARGRWLVEAQYLGDDLKFDADLFPPPVTQRYRELARQLPRTRPAVEASGWPVILINGVRCAPGSCPSVPAPSRAVRVTFLSNQWVAQTHQVDVAQLGRLQPARFPFVAGACGSAELSVAARALGDGRAFFGFACEAPILVPHLAAAAATAAVTAPPSSVARPAGPRRAFYKSPWLWAGVGAAVVTAVALAARPARHGEDPPPSPPPPPSTTTIYGY